MKGVMMLDGKYLKNFISFPSISGNNAREELSYSQDFLIIPSVLFEHQVLFWGG
jgi:hypothetical protein